MRDLIMRKGYRTSIDRAGYALAAGGALCGGLATLLTIAGGQTGMSGVVAVALVSTLLAMMAITAVAAPIWAVMHMMGRRRAHHAMLVGALTGFLIFTASQTYGFGLADPPPSDALTMMMRWISAMATSAVLALASALIGLAMWRVAYRPD